MKVANAWRSWPVRGIGVFALLGAMALPTLNGTVHAQDSGPALEVVSPADGETITTTDIEVEVAISDFTVDCSKTGRPDEDGVGHIHAMVDGMSMAQLANFYCSETLTIPGDGLAPGKHLLIIDLSTNTHMDMMETAQEIEIDYQPENPVALPEAEDLGVPGVELVSPIDGATVGETVDIEIAPINFNPSAGLEGKPNVPGYGHWHVFVDTPMDGMGMMGDDEEMASSPAADDDMAMATPTGDGMAMMSMAGMVAMPGDNTFELDLSAWGPGEHVIFIEPVQNDHTNFAEFDPIEFTVTVDPDA